MTTGFYHTKDSSEHEFRLSVMVQSQRAVAERCDSSEVRNGGNQK